jgi:PAS domain S-box-containing protein
VRSAVWWRTLFELAPDPCFLLDRDGVFLDWNPAAEALTLLTRDEAVGRPFHALGLLDATETRAAKRDVRECFAARRPSGRDYVIHRRDGSNAIVEPKTHLIQLDDDAVLFCILRDVTEHRRSEAEARRSEARLSRAQRAARIGTWEFDLRTGDVWWSDEMYRVFPRDPATWKPTLTEFFGAIVPEDRDRLPIPASPPESSDSPYCFTARFEVVPGRVRYLRVEGVVGCDAGGVPAEMFGTTQDVTDHMLADERLREYQRQLRELASQISLAEEKERRRIAGGLHDRAIQTLALSQIKLGALRNSLEGDPNRTRLIDEVRKLVDHAIHDTRSLVFELSPPVLHELGFEAAVESLAELVEDEHAIHCKVKSAGTPIRMAADVEISLFQAVREALINTVKHARATHALVTLDWRCPEAIAVCVEDDGKGFDVGEVETRRSRAGGFGLFSMRERLGVLGGRAEVTSARGNGTRVRLEMPLPLRSSPA